MPTSGPPAFTPEQRAAALAKAGEARRLRAEVKELLKTGSVTLVEVLARGETEDYIGGMKVESVLESLPGLGKIKTKRLMEELGIASNRRLRGLGERQRAALLQHLG
jgi:DNA polymerase/3'-5' exonuclease PolX